MKQNITQQEFAEKLKNCDYFYDEIFNFGKENIMFPNEFPIEIKFSNCSFTGEIFKIEDINESKKSIIFQECVFKCKIEVFNCYLDTLHFYDTYEIEALSFNSYVKNRAIIEDFIFSYNLGNPTIPNLEIDFAFQNYIFRKNFAIENISMSKGSFYLSRCELGENNHHSKASFINSKFHNLYLSKTLFKSELSFSKSKFNYISENFKSYKLYKFCCIEDCDFAKVSFSNCNFDRIFGIIKCTFNNQVDFHNVKNAINSDLRIISSTFNEYVHFENANLYVIFLHRTSFHGIVSFQKLKVNHISIDKTIFDKNTYFDEIKILRIIACTRQTIRLIKQQLQKAENKIDYNRFRAYELSAYYRELKLYNNFVDKSILGLTILFTGYNHNWFRALVVTILIGLMFYTGLYFIEFHGPYNPDKIEDFFVRAFRFFLITDFYSPFKEREYLDNFWSWFPFVLGKIVIAFGIYEMIQAFRKFKV